MRLQRLSTIWMPSFCNRAGAAVTVKNAVCIHEGDTGILFEHTDFRDGSAIVTRGRKLVVSQIFTAANYEHCVCWIMHQVGAIQLEIKLTGILNTYAMAPGEDTHGWGTEVHPGVNVSALPRRITRVLCALTPSTPITTSTCSVSVSIRRSTASPSSFGTYARELVV